MKKIIRLTEQDLTKLIKKVILEIDEPSYDEYQDAIEILRKKFGHGKLDDKKSDELKRIKNGDEDTLKELEKESWGSDFKRAINVIRQYTQIENLDTKVSHGEKKPIALYKVGEKEYSKFKDEDDKKYYLIVKNPKYKKWNSPNDEITQEDIKDAKEKEKDGIILYRAKDRSGQDKEIFSVVVFNNNQVKEIDG